MLFDAAQGSPVVRRNPTCAICGQKIASIDDSAVDHIKQYWTGGQTIPENARLAHRFCNWSRPRTDSWPMNVAPELEVPPFPAGSCRVSTKPPARVPVSCTSRAAICWRPPSLGTRLREQSDWRSIEGSRRHRARVDDDAVEVDDPKDGSH